MCDVGLMIHFPEDYCPCAAYPDCTLQGDWFCWEHNVHETPATEPYRVCFECGHVYLTAQEVCEAYRDGAKAAGDRVTPRAPGLHPLIEVERIHFCAHCLHGW